MKTIILTALAAAVLGTSAIADVSGTSLSSRAAPSDVVVFERDKGVYGAATARSTVGILSLVDADRVLLPREQAIATDGKVAVYSFAAPARSDALSFPRR